VILLLTTRKSPAIEPTLLTHPNITTLRVPAPPSGGKPAERVAIATSARWAYRPMKKIDRIIQEEEVSAIVCADRKSWMFAQRVAERYPQVAVLSDQQLASRILVTLQDRAERPSRQAVHDLLDKLRPNRPETPGWLLRPEDRPQTIVSLVPGPISDYPRAKIAAQNLAESGYVSVVLGTDTPDDPGADWHLLGTALAMELRVSAVDESPIESVPGALAKVANFHLPQETNVGLAEKQLGLEIARLQVAGEQRIGHRIRQQVQRVRTALRPAKSSATPARTKNGGSTAGSATDASRKHSPENGDQTPNYLGPFESEIAPRLEDLLPDAIYVHDISLMGIAVRSRNRLRKLGISPLLIYDFSHDSLQHLLGSGADPSASLAVGRKFVAEFDVGLTDSERGQTLIGERLRPMQPPTVVVPDPGYAIAERPDHGNATMPVTPDTASLASTDLIVQEVAERIGEPRPPVIGVSELLIGAQNSAGQAYAWARSLRDCGIKAVSMEEPRVDAAFAYPADLKLPQRAFGSLDRRINLLLNLVASHPALILESGVPLAAPNPARLEPRRLGFHEARVLHDAGKNVGLMFHGSDIRQPDLHMRTHEWSPFKNPAAAELTERLRENTQIVHEELASWAGPVMISTPDLLSVLPSAQWVPVVVDLSEFPLTDRLDENDGNDTPLVVHLPSSSIKKGSHLIEPVLRQLASEGVIRYASYQQIPHSEVPELISQADIFVDQIGMGILGVAGIEAMASGTVLVTDPGPEALVAYGEDVPLVAVNPETLADQLRRLAADPERRRELATAGRQFVERHHDGRRSAAAIIETMSLPLDTKQLPER